MIDFDPDSLIDVVRQTVDQVMDSVDEPTLRAVGFSGAELFREAAKSNALSHAKTYTIHRNIIVKRLEEESDGGNRQAYLVTVRKGPQGGDDAYYWRWVENGHNIVRENKNVNPKTGRKFDWKGHRRSEAEHRRRVAELENGSARVPAYSFMRPAYESEKQDAVDRMMQTLAELIARNANR